MSASSVNFKKKYKLDELSVLASSPLSKVCAKDFFRSGGAPVFREEFNCCSFDGTGAKSAVSFFFDFDKKFTSCDFRGGDSVLKICRGGNIEFIDCDFELDKDSRLGSICSGARNVIFESCSFNFNGKSQGLFSLILGGWSIWNIVKRPFVFNVRFKDCKVLGVKKIRALSIYSARVNVENSPVKSFFIPSFIVGPCWFFLRLYNKFFNKKIPDSAYVLRKEEFNV